MHVAELADVPHHPLKPRHRGRRRELPGDRPAWIATHRPQPALQLEIVHLHDDPVDLEVEPAPALLPVQALRDDLILAGEQPYVLVHAKAVLAQPRERL